MDSFRQFWKCSWLFIPFTDDSETFVTVADTTSNFLQLFSPEYSRSLSICKKAPINYRIRLCLSKKLIIAKNSYYNIIAVQYLPANYEYS
jgi:hypothetical protein